MEIQELRRHWDGMGQEDPLWAILTEPGKTGGQIITDRHLGRPRYLCQIVAQVRANNRVIPKTRRRLQFHIAPFWMCPVAKSGSVVSRP